MYYFPFQSRNRKIVSLSAIVLNVYELVPVWMTGDEYEKEIWTKSSVYTRRKNLTQKIHVFSILLFRWFPPHTQSSGVWPKRSLRRRRDILCMPHHATRKIPVFSIYIGLVHSMTSHIRPFFHSRSLGNLDFNSRTVMDQHVALSFGSGSILTQKLPPLRLRALMDMYPSLKTAPWAAPFLHPRVRASSSSGTPRNDSTAFQSYGRMVFDGRSFQFWGHICQLFMVLIHPASSDGIANRLGSKWEASYNRLSVILSDVARFIVTHRFGGVYIDADTLLRD